MSGKEEKRLPDLREKWPERLERLRRSQARVDPRGMTRPPRDPDERDFLRKTDQTGPFTEIPVTGDGTQSCE
jgi:hypothetical protein